MLWPLYTRRCNSAEINDAEASDASGQRGQEEIPAPARTYPVANLWPVILKAEKCQLIRYKAPTKDKHT